MPLTPKPYLRQVSLPPQDPQHYPFNIPAVQHLNPLTFHPDVTFFIGENGAGKSTVLEAIALAYGFGKEGGTLNVKFETTDSVSPLHQSLKLAKGPRRPDDHYFLRAETFFNVATYMDEIQLTQSYGGSLHQKSHGEAFMALLTQKLRGRGLYLLDEPEAALSPQRQLAALSAIDQLVRRQSQFIIATHSPILLAYPNAKILRFDENGIAETAYEATDHYSITRDFLNHYPRRLEQLLK